MEISGSLKLSFLPAVFVILPSCLSPPLCGSGLSPFVGVACPILREWLIPPLWEWLCCFSDAAAEASSFNFSSQTSHLSKWGVLVLEG